MKKNESETNSFLNGSTGNRVCNLGYLTEMMNSKNHLIKGIMDIFLTQVPEELHYITTAISKTDYPSIKSLAHTMKSSVSILGITILAPILQEMENLAVKATGIERIKELNQTLNQICKQAIEEVEKAKHNYV